MPHVKEYVRFVREDGSDAEARVLSKREHNIIVNKKEVPVVILDLKVFNGETVDVRKSCKEGTKAGCWHE